MYSRYRPGPDGVYLRQRVENRPVSKPAPDIPPAAPPIPAAAAPVSLRRRLGNLLPESMELGDILVLLIALLLMIDAEEDLQTVLITAAAFFLL